MKVKILKAEKESYWYANDIGKTFKVTGRICIDDSYQLTDDPAYYISKVDCKVIKKRKVYLKRESDCKIPENDSACDHCHLDTYNEKDFEACEKILEKYNLGNCNDDDTHFKLIKIEVTK